MDRRDRGEDRGGERAGAHAEAPEPRGTLREPGDRLPEVPRRDGRADDREERAEPDRPGEEEGERGDRDELAEPRPAPRGDERRRREEEQHPRGRGEVRAGRGHELDDHQPDRRVLR
jgi:hypothetical protein